MSPIIDPSFLTGGAEWQIGSPQGTPGTEAAGGFGDVLTGQISKLSDLQNQAADASLELATGHVPPAPVVSGQKALSKKDSVRSK